MTVEILIYYFIVLGISLIIFLLFYKKVQAEVWVEKNKLKVRKYLKTDAYNFDQVSKISMVAKPDVVYDNIPVLGITFKIMLKNGQTVIINKSWENGWMYMQPKNKAPSLAVETLKRIIRANPQMEVDEFTRDYLNGRFSDRVPRL